MMDNQTEKRLDQKCELFNRLYRGSATDKGCARLPISTCLNFKISDQYMYPKVSGSDHIKQHAPQCHLSGQQLGQHIIRDSQTKPQIRTSNLDRDLLSSFSINGLPTNKIMEEIDKLKKNPDFQHASNMVISGGQGIVEYFVNHLPQIVDQNGGSADETSDLIYSLRNTANTIGGIANDLISSLTVGDAVESFLNYYNQSGGSNSPTHLDRSLKVKLDSLKNDGMIYYYMLNGLFSKITVNDLITNCLQVYNSTNNIAQQFGGQPDYRHGNADSMAVKTTTTQQYTDEMIGLFENLKSTVDVLTTNFKERISRSGAPVTVIASIDQIRQGATLALQILQHQLVTETQTDYKFSPNTNGTIRELRTSGNSNSRTYINDNGHSTSNMVTSRPYVESMVGGNYEQTHRTSVCPMCNQIACRCNHSHFHDDNSIPITRRANCSVHPLAYRHPNDGNIIPSVYLDPCQVPIAKHPIRARRTLEYEIPTPVQYCPRHNLRKCLSCRQPHWRANCM